MPFSNETLARVFIERYAEELGWEIADTFGEPGYGDPDGPIVVGTTTVWRDGQRHYIEDLHPLAYREWDWYNGGVWPHDEWMVDHRHTPVKAYRTQPDSYMWQPSVIYDDNGGYLTPDDDIETWIDWAHNDERRCLMGDLYSGSDLEQVGFTLWDPDHEGSWRGRGGTYETGWHAGQNDSPAAVTEAIRHVHGDSVDIVFVLDEQSQFYAVWSAYIRPTDYEYDRDTDVLYALNDAIGQVCANWGLLDRFDGDDKDSTLDDAVHAAFNILTGREQT